MRRQPSPSAVAAALISTAQVARIANRDRSTVTRWVESGRLVPAVVTDAGYFLFHTEDVEALAAELEAAS